MANVAWAPPSLRPPDGDALEAEIERVAPRCEARVTEKADGWLVRALAPVPGCGRDRSFEDRDVSERVAEVLTDAGYPARA